MGDKGELEISLTFSTGDPRKWPPPTAKVKLCVMGGFDIRVSSFLYFWQLIILLGWAINDIVWLYLFKGSKLGLSKHFH